MTQRSGGTLTVLRNREAMQTKLDRIADRARKDSAAQFSSLMHLLDEEMLRDSFRRLSGSAAPGVDKVTKEEYAENLEANIADVIDRLKRRAYHPQPVRRKYIPKVGSDKLRPLGIPVLEDKLVQSAITRILEQIYEQNFMDFSFGFRPQRGCHDALQELDHVIMRQKVSYVVDADIQGFFDHVSHEWMMKFVQHKITDTPLLQLIQRFLKAGVMEEDRWQATEEGVPQGGSISPILANVYLHYALDLWFDRIVKRNCRGQAFMIRYADDFVACFQYEDEAKLFYQALQERLAKFELTIAVEKTRIIKFGRFAATDAERDGKGKPETFDFLGFTHYCGKSRKGKFMLKRRTARKKFRAKIIAFAEWLKENRQKPLKELWPLIAAKLRGHYQYYGVSDNSRSINKFYQVVRRICFKWLNRRSNRRSFNWDSFCLMLKRHPLPTPKILVPFYPLELQSGHSGSRMR